MGPDDRLSLAPPRRQEIRYDPRIPSFSDVRQGDWVSVHWGFASERLTPHQLRNLKKYTALDVEATNRLVSTRRGAN
jgi:hydrogenase maturation factor